MCERGEQDTVDAANNARRSAANEIGRVGLRYLVPWTVLLAFAFGLGVSLPGEFRKAVSDWRKPRVPSSPPEDRIETKDI